MKPFDLSEFVVKTSIVIRECFDSHHIDIETDDAFLLKKEANGRRLVKILKRDIIYIQGSNNHVHIYTTKGESSVYLTFTEMVGRMDKNPKFYRVQRSYMINSDQFDELEGNTIYLKGFKVIMSPLYNANFQAYSI